VSRAPARVGSIEQGNGSTGDSAHAGLGLRERAKRDKLERIIRAATKLFGEHGFEGTTTAAVSEAAGIGAGTLFLYFPTKEDLLVRVFQEELSRIWDDAFRNVDPQRPFIDQLTSLFGEVIDVHERDPALARAFVKEVLFVGEEARRGVNEFINGFLERLAALAEGAQQRGELDADVPTKALADNLYALYSHLLQIRHGGYLDLPALRRRLRLAFEMQLRGITTGPPART
jgi:AcrR family transcriptional regulator